MDGEGAYEAPRGQVGAVAHPPLTALTWVHPSRARAPGRTGPLLVLELPDHSRCSPARELGLLGPLLWVLLSLGAWPHVRICFLGLVP